MAGKNPVADVQEVLSYEQQLEALPDLPARPFLLPGDYPEGDLASLGEAKFRTQLWERERDARQYLGGFDPYANCGPESPAQVAARLEEDAEYREQRYGLPDSPADMAPMAGGERSRPY
jgi:hypothetical protein